MSELVGIAMLVSIAPWLLIATAGLLVLLARRVR